MRVLSYGRFDPEGSLGCNWRRGRIRFDDIEINASSCDKAILRMETAYMTMRAWTSYDESILDDLTIPPDSNTIANYYTRNSAGVLGYKSSGYREWRKVSDVLGIVEFFVNRFNPLNDEQIKQTMVTARSCVVGLAAEASRTPIRKNRLQFRAYEKKDGTLPRLVIRGRHARELDGFRELLDMCLTADPEWSATGIPSGGFYDAFVRIDTGNDQMKELYEHFWKDIVPDGSDQLEAREAYLPLGYLIDSVSAIVSSLPSGHPLRFTVDSDIRDAGLSVTYPLDAFLGPMGYRDGDFETSDSSISLIAAASEEYISAMAVYSRVLHAVMLGSIVEDDRISLSFSAGSCMRLADPMLVDRCYPMKMYFTPGATRALDGYRDAMEAAGCIVPTNRMQDIVIEWQGCGAEVDWPDTSRSNGHLRDRASTATVVPVRLLSGDIGRDIGTLDRRMCSERGPCYIIIVSVPEDRKYTYRLIANLRSPEHVSALIVMGDETYFEKRYMLSDISEIGIRDVQSLLDIQMNGFCRRRSEARRALAGYLESDPHATDATTVAGSAVSALVTASDLACREAICKVGREE